MKKIIAAIFIFGVTNIASAIPSLQVHGVDSVAYDGFGDEDTWLLTESSGRLELIGTYGPNTVNINNAYLVMTTAALDGNPFGSDYAKYDDSDAFEASLAGFDPKLKLNNHNPYGLDASLIDIFAYDLSLLDMGRFAAAGPTKDCNADVPGTTECAAASNSVGEIHTFNYDFTNLGLDWVHFDLVAFVTDEHGRRWTTTGEINPGSHDSTWRVSEPASLVLLSLGLFGLGFIRRKV